MVINCTDRMLLISLIVSVLVILAMGFKISFAQRGASCITPIGKNATCVTVSACKPIYDAIETGTNTTAIEFAKQSQCGYDSEPLVCCDSPLLPPHILKIFLEAEKIKNQDNINALSNFHTQTLPDTTVCGLKKWSNKVYGGNATEIGEFPWMVALEYKYKKGGKSAGIQCSGSLINSRYVMTAAHCIKIKNLELTNVRLGEWNIATDQDCSESIIDCAEPMRKINIKEKIPHPFYISPTSGTNDIGLLRLEEDIKYTKYMRPICLPTLNLPTPEFGTNLTVAGWGLRENGTPSDVLLKVEVPLIPNTNCRSKVLNGNQLCAGGKPGKDSCQGDSGGPLMRLYEDTFKQQLQWYQDGVVARGAGCGTTGVYTRVSRYLNWIISTIKKD